MVVRGGRGLAARDRCLADGRPRSINVVVGPEGGISEQEVSDFVGAGAQSVVLGSNILRASTAGPLPVARYARPCYPRNYPTNAGARGGKSRMIILF